MTTLIIAEHDGQQIHSTLNRTISAAQQWGAAVHVLIAGYQIAGLAQQTAQIEGIARVLQADAEHLEHSLAEDLSQLIVSIGHQYDVILAAHSSFSRNILPRAAALLDVAMISDVLEIKADNQYVRAIYAGNIHATVKSSDNQQILTLRANHFKSAALADKQAEVIQIEVPAAFGKSRWISETRIESDLPDLGSAKVVVSGGRSLGSAEQFEKVLTPLAHKLGAAIGATRAAVDAGYAPNEIQVGQTGITVSPELYIAIGISGAVQHTAGMKDSRVVVAINDDPDAPIFQVADYGLVADLFEVIPNLTNVVKQGSTA